jgi:hypothetical protein
MPAPAWEAEASLGRIASLQKENNKPRIYHVFISGSLHRDLNEWQETLCYEENKEPVTRKTNCMIRDLKLGATLTPARDQV